MNEWDDPKVAALAEDLDAAIRQVAPGLIAGQGTNYVRWLAGAIAAHLAATKVRAALADQRPGENFATGKVFDAWRRHAAQPEDPS